MQVATESSRGIDVHDATYVARMKKVLRKHYYHESGEEFLESDCGKRDLKHHLSERYEMAANHVVPWLKSRYNLTAWNVIEVGSGTGSSTLALSQSVQSITCFEISRNSTAIATERLACWDVQNVKFVDELFDRKCRFVKSGRRADAILLFATLEHMTHKECLSILEVAWETVAPGGALIVADTPNRFSFVDEHTAWLPFFASLPREIQVAYAKHSPREDFRSSIDRAQKAWPSFWGKRAAYAMTRWGSGISYHEFELAIGMDVHRYVTLDGMEPEITSLIPIDEIDEGLRTLLAKYSSHVHRAFSRRSFYLVLEKPAK